MPNEETNGGEPGCGRVTADQRYEVRYLAEKYRLSHQQTRSLIARIGNRRQKLEQAARDLKLQCT